MVSETADLFLGNTSGLVFPHRQFSKGKLSLKPLISFLSLNVPLDITCPSKAAFFSL